MEYSTQMDRLEILSILLWALSKDSEGKRKLYGIFLRALEAATPLPLCLVKL